MEGAHLPLVLTAGQSHLKRTKPTLIKAALIEGAVEELTYPSPRH